ncbi:glycosyl hydrolase family 88 [Cladophialophora carrionii]|uniref:Glycosyl hydrolase family 88 n=1 Tax=Cladophialophora carrionii TaxID=86049 RepID=A0A1C1CUE5_9EURO|nr:glycosyl hydrolase family 88 [Cladophialophora carrionii]
MRGYVASLCVAAFSAVVWLILSAPDAGFDPHEVLNTGRSITSRSWEFGTLVEALLEFYNHELTVFGSNPFPGGLIPQIDNPSKVEALAYAKSVIWINGTDLLVDGEGSAADPASLGTAALLLSHHDPRYLEAAKRQAEYLVSKATKFRVNGTHSAISHREDVPELWGDFIYMVPPFLVYHGVATQDLRFLEMAVLQCQLYDRVLRTDIELENGENCHGLWRHIVSDPPDFESGVCCSDPDVWLTSNAWAVAGMTRVLATILKWQPPRNSPIGQTEYNEFRTKSRVVLADLIESMLQCTMAQAEDEESGLLKNYLDGPSHRSAAWAYGDAAGTALMASAMYRLAVLLPEAYGGPTAMGWAERNRRAVARHVHSGGRVGPVADVGHVPSKSPVSQTSEGQSMVILMYSAWRACKEGTSWKTALRRLRQWV